MWAFIDTYINLYISTVFIVTIYTPATHSNTMATYINLYISTVFIVTIYTCTPATHSNTMATLVTYTPLTRKSTSMPCSSLVE